jgi:hypothetical protein
MPLETSVLEFDAGALRCLFVKTNLDLAGHVQVRFEGPFGADIPTKDNANRRLVDEDACPSTFGSIDGSVEDVTPTRGSNMVSAIGALSRLCSGGLKSPNRSVNTENARSIAESTTTCRRTVAWVWVMTFPFSLLG